MRYRSLSFSLLIVLGSGLASLSIAGPQDPNQEDVRGAFLTSRPTASDKPAKSTTARPSRRRPKTSAAKSPPGSKEGSKATPVGNTAGDGTPQQGRATSQRLGLGLTLFMRDSNGLAVRVDPNHEFHQGDRVRVLLETNADGHLYIFNTTNDGDPVMIYPNPQLDDAGNYLQAHVPFEIPSSLSAEERLRWLTFDEHAGTEELYFVFTREPLAGVPIEDDLIKYCGENKIQCAWHPTPDLWAGLRKEMEAPLTVDTAKSFGRAQSSTEHDAATRGIGLAKTDPEPSLVMMTASSGPGRLVTGLELSHK
jgi:hypothetical protein